MAAQLAEQVTVVAAAGTEGGGAALDQVLGMSIATGIITAGLLYWGTGYYYPPYWGGGAYWPRPYTYGAAAWYNTAAWNSALHPGQCFPACLEYFSSAGGVPTFFDKFGNRQRTEVPQVARARDLAFFPRLLQLAGGGGQLSVLCVLVGHGGTPAVTGCSPLFRRGAGT